MEPSDISYSFTSVRPGPWTSITPGSGAANTNAAITRMRETELSRITLWNRQPQRAASTQLAR